MRRILKYSPGNTIITPAIFFPKYRPKRRSFKELELRGKIGKPPALLVIFKIDACFRQRIAGTAHHVLKFPDLEEACAGLVSGREQNVGVKKRADGQFSTIETRRASRRLL